MTKALPAQPDPQNRPVCIALADHAVDLPRIVASAISDIRFPSIDVVEGLRIRDGEWVDLTAFGARIQPPADLPELEVE